MIDGHKINDVENAEMIFGEGEGAAGGAITVPNPIGINNKQYEFDYYCAMAAAGLFSLVDMEQYPNADDISQKIINRTKTFAKKVKEAFPNAFL